MDVHKFRGDSFKAEPQKEESLEEINPAQFDEDNVYVLPLVEIAPLPEIPFLSGRTETVFEKEPQGFPRTPDGRKVR